MPIRHRCRLPPRRSISVRGETYARLARYADELGVTIGALVEEWAILALDSAGHGTVSGPASMYAFASPTAPLRPTIASA